MPHRVCPTCRAPGRLLEAASKDATVEYYRCDACGHVWNHDKANPNAPPRHVTSPQMTSESVTLHLYCDQCAAAISVLLRPTATLGTYPDPTSEPWACPHGCGTTKGPVLLGAILDVWPGHCAKPYRMTAGVPGRAGQR